MGLRKTPGIDLEFELEDGYYALGFAKGMSEEISSKYHLTAVVEYAFSMMSEDFNDQMMIDAESTGSTLHHVYEPGYLGTRGMELWENKLYGRGERRQASFQWKQSVMPILNPRERARDPEDPMSEVDEEVIDKLSNEEYVFRMRAPIMEYGIRTTITPRPGTKRLFIPTFGLHHPWKRKNGDAGSAEHFRFEKVNIPDWNFANPQEPSGGAGNIGQFTTRFVAYWGGGGADAIWKSHILKAVEGGLDDWGTEFNKEIKKTSRNRKGKATLHSFNDTKAAMENGRNLAKAFIKGKARSYASAQKYIEKNGSFGGDVNY